MDLRPSSNTPQQPQSVKRYNTDLKMFNKKEVRNKYNFRSTIHCTYINNTNIVLSFCRIGASCRIIFCGGEISRLTSCLTQPSRDESPIYQCKLLLTGRNYRIPSFISRYNLQNLEWYSSSLGLKWSKTLSNDSIKIYNIFLL